MKVALQLYTVRDKMKVDYISTLKAVADVGYKYVEFTGHIYDYRCFRFKRIFR